MGKNPIFSPEIVVPKCPTILISPELSFLTAIAPVYPLPSDFTRKPIHAKIYSVKWYDIPFFTSLTLTFEPLNISSQLSWGLDIYIGYLLQFLDAIASDPCQYGTKPILCIKEFCSCLSILICKWESKRWAESHSSSGDSLKREVVGDFLALLHWLLVHLNMSCNLRMTSNSC